MLLALALLLVQPYPSTPTSALAAEKPAVIQPAQPVESQPIQPAEVTVSSTPSADANPEPPMSDLVVAPTPQPTDPAPIIISEPAGKETISVDELRAENQRKQRLWLGLSLAAHSTASFDAATTRFAITQRGAHELNPFFKPFAGNASMYIAIQVGPTVLDFVARKMMYDQHSWIRRVWWVPQSASAITSIFCGVHNLGVPSPSN